MQFKDMEVNRLHCLVLGDNQFIENQIGKKNQDNNEEKDHIPCKSSLNSSKTI